MADPLLIEQNFQTLKQTLRLISSSRLRILRIVEFIEDLLNSPTFFPAYAPELLPQLVESINKTDFTGTNLRCLERCIKLLGRIENDQPSVAGNSEFKQAQQHLKAESEKIQSWLKSKNIEGLEGYSHKKFDVGSVWIPMVEREQFLTAVNPLFASLQKLYVEAIFSKKEAVVDKLHIKQLSHTEETRGNELLNTVEAARYLLGKFAHIKTGKRVTINCSFDNPTFVEGQSLQAGLAAGLFTELLHLHQHKEEYTLRDDVAITGSIDKQANLLPVDEGGLKLKVEACYFSHIKYLIVPKEQEGICKDVIAKLNLAHEQSSTLPPKNGGIAQTDGNSDKTKQGVILSDPEFNYGKSTYDGVAERTKGDFILSDRRESKDGHHLRNLEVVGISNLEELFYNRKFTNSRHITVARQTARKVWKLRRPIAVVLIVSLLLIIGKMWYGPLDKNPVDYSADGEMLSLKNKYGEVVEKIIVGHNTVGEINHRISQNLCNIVSLFDINGDKINEVIYAQAYQDAADNITRVFCKDIIKDSIYWSMDVVRRLKFPSNSSITGELFTVANIAVGDYDNDGKVEIYINAKHYCFFPGWLIKLNAMSGKKLAEYINIGQCNDMRFIDINGDNVAEIILSGTNNAYNMASVAILDSRFIEGHSPLRADYDIEDFKPGLEKAYILIPRTIVGNYYRYKYSRNDALQIEIIAPSKLIKINVHECPLPYADKMSAVYYPQFDFELNVMNVGTGDTYGLLARQLYDEGNINQRVDDNYFNEYKKQILYWDGDKFVNHFALNKRYLEAVVKLKPLN